MVPPEVFPETMRTLGHITPHAWAMDALREVALRDGETLVAIAAAARRVLAGSRRDPPARPRDGRFRRQVTGGAI